MIAESSPCACAIVTSGFNRTNPSIHRAPRSSSLYDPALNCGCIDAGTQNWNA
jgi:hypothetical protein